MLTLPVIFRKDRNGGITAVFPTEPADHHYAMTCYGHIGQHSGCSREWYYTTSLAQPSEYNCLLIELRQIYENDEDEPITLTVRQRITPAMRRDFMNNFRRMMRPS